MRRKYYYISLLISLLIFSRTSMAAPAYTELTRPVSDAPQVVEFFSFYCVACYRFTDEYPVANALYARRTPGTTLVKYHVDAMGELGPALSMAWAVAVISGIADKVERPLFIALLRDRKLKGPDDIRDIFVQAGMSPQIYEGAQHNIMVRAFAAQQKKMSDAFRVTRTPSFYVRGRFLINNAEIKASSPAEYVTNFADMVALLLQKNDSHNATGPFTDNDVNQAI